MGVTFDKLLGTLLSHLHRGEDVSSAVAEATHAASADTATHADDADTLEGNSATAFAATDDPRLSDARTPTAHATSHAAAGDDPLTGYVTDGDARLSDARTPIAHAASHASAGDDPLTPSAIGAAEADHEHEAGAGARRLLDTAANIQASDPASYELAFSTDTLELWLSDGVGWRKVAFPTVSDPAAPDMGYTQESSRIGIHADAITDKRLSNVSIGTNARTPESGDVRVLAEVLSVYLAGVWKDVVTGFRLREDSTGGYEFEHQPIGFSEWVEIVSGNGNSLGLNGLPIVQQYGASMGVYPAPVQIDGGML